MMIHGGFGSVRISATRVLKFVEKIENEVKYLDKCKDINGVVKLKNWFKLDKDNREFYKEKNYKYCLEFVKIPNTIDLFEYISQHSPIPTANVTKIFKGVIHIISDLEKINVVHGDIKDENILINKETKEVTLIDFGTCYEGYDKELPDDLQTTKMWAPREFLLEEPITGLQLTLYSLGLLLYSLSEGDLPFQTTRDIIKKKKISFDFTCKKHQQLVKKLMTWEYKCVSEVLNDF